MKNGTSFVLVVWGLFRSCAQKMKNGTSFVLHNFVDVGVKKDIHSERERERDELNK